MDTFKLFYPVRQQINKTNLFGTPSPLYAALKLKGHEGLDFGAPSGTKIYAPCDGLAMYVTDTRGGDGLWIQATVGGQNYIVILWHMWRKGDPQYPFQIPAEPGFKTQVKAGQFLGYSDNSGAPNESTGPHLHLGVLVCNPDWTVASPENGYHGCVDPMPFFNGLFADSVGVLPAAQAIVKQTCEVVKQVKDSPEISKEDKADLLAEIKKVVQVLEGIF